MPEEGEHLPGDPASESGHCEELNVFRTPTGKIVHIEQGETLPRAPRSFTWRRIEREQRATSTAGFGWSEHHCQCRLQHCFFSLMPFTGMGRQGSCLCYRLGPLGVPRHEFLIGWVIARDKPIKFRIEGMETGAHAQEFGVPLLRLRTRAIADFGIIPKHRRHSFAVVSTLHRSTPAPIGFSQLGRAADITPL
jgi:hypothetical protein